MRQCDQPSERIACAILFDALIGETVSPRDKECLKPPQGTGAAGDGLDHLIVRQTTTRKLHTANGAPCHSLRETLRSIGRSFQTAEGWRNAGGTIGTVATGAAIPTTKTITGNACPHDRALFPSRNRDLPPLRLHPVNRPDRCLTRNVRYRTIHQTTCV